MFPILIPVYPCEAGVPVHSKMMQDLAKTNEHTSTAPDGALTVDKGRHLLFVSHANPEDNAAASWFATQLTLLGYDVWCDLRNTHAGESDVWLKVQNTIEHDTAKFIFILSNSSRDFSKKKGVYKEVQAADTLRRKNFILPLRIEPLTGSVPIIIGPDLNIDSENWADGLRQLHNRLIEDDVPRVRKPDYLKIAAWWPALSVEDLVVRDAPQSIVSTMLPFRSIPENVHLLKVTADGNPIAGYERLNSALPRHPAHYAHGEYAVSFACAHDYPPSVSGFEIEEHVVLQTPEFIENGDEGSGIVPQVARNIVTFLVASALEQFLEHKGLQKKTVRYNRRKTWYPADGLIDKNKFSITEPGRRKVPVQLVGTTKHYKKRYSWHFGVLPVVDLYTLSAILLTPKAILTLPYKTASGETPVPIDEKKALKKLAWWNKEWRQKLSAFTAWLSEGNDRITLPVGYQDIVLSGQPETMTGGV